ncbi:uncharacterized protein LOC117497224 [Scomber scombrus]|uniref:Uncharacterized protein LOC117497224 n=1 Tax=Scomber scombrus TaxID=13677 RepID=A0AAV1PNG0_SCOSC
MSQLRTISALIFLVKVACFWREVSCVPAILGDSVNLTAVQQCKVDSVTHRRKNDKTTSVVRLKEGVWEPEQDYTDRVTPISNTSVVLNNVNYNDAGLYEITCADPITDSTIKLDVVVPSEVLVIEGGEGKLPYYFNTADEVKVRFIRWVKNNKLVCQLNLSYPNVTYGKEFNGKVSVSPDWFEQGDLSLNLKRAELQDQGVFFINLLDKDGEEIRTDAGVTLRVQKRSDLVTPHESRGEKAMGTSGTVCITVAVTLLLVALAAGCAGFACCLKCRKRPSQHVDMDNRSQDWLPNQFRCHVCQYDEVPSAGDYTSFDATVRVDVRTVDQAKQWIQLLKGSSGVTWRVDVTRPRLGHCVLFKASYKCQHKVHVKAASSSRDSKNTCCQAKMLVTLKSPGGETSKTKDPHMFPFEVRIANRHNHHLFVADAIRYRDVGEKAKEALMGLFEIGHTPTSALDDAGSQAVAQRDVFQLGVL